uniref:Uncharacterized protein n=1 Tax=uncultured prokaryote TaxID=198431 RepID=A0A0H5Q1R4_9ZZZZ|nr:hypothetical protein [uncultured prokaryote]
MNQTEKKERARKAREKASEIRSKGLKKLAILIPDVASVENDEVGAGAYITVTIHFPHSNFSYSQTAIVKNKRLEQVYEDIDLPKSKQEPLFEFPDKNFFKKRVRNKAEQIAFLEEMNKIIRKKRA